MFSGTRPHIPATGWVHTWLAPCLALSLSIAASYVASLAINHNDKAMHRACAYLVHHAGSESVRNVQTELASHWHGVSSPQTRLAYCNSYFLPPRLTYWVEHVLPVRSAFQSVLIAQLALHLLMLLLCLAVIRMALGTRAATWYMWALAFSLLPWQSIAGWAFPFSNAFFSPHTWRTPYPRGAAHLGVFSAFVVLTYRATDLAVGRRRLLAILPFVFAASMHHAVAILDAVACGVAYTIGSALLQPHALSSWLQRWSWLTPAHPTFSARRLVFICITLSVMKTLANVAYFYVALDLTPAQLWPSRGLQAAALLATALGVAYLVASIALVSAARRSAVGTLPFADGLTRLLLGLAIVIAVGYPFAPTAHDWDTSIGILFYEPPRRLLGMAHLAFFILGYAVLQDFWRAHSLPKQTWAALGLVYCIHVAVASVTEVRRSLDTPELTPVPRWTAHILDPHALTIHIEELASHTMGDYSDYMLYQAVANELRDQERTLPALQH